MATTRLAARAGLEAGSLAFARANALNLSPRARAIRHHPIESLANIQNPVGTPLAQRVAEQRQLEGAHVNRLLIISLLLFAPSCDSKDADADAKPADNTKTNERDRNEANKTPLDQSEAASDVELTAKIRSELMDDDSLSMNAKNIKIITAEGIVTLRGPVSSDEEKTTIEKIARGAADPQRVDNQLEIAAD